MPSFVNRGTRERPRWAYVVSLGRDPATGRYRQQWRSGFPTKKAAMEAWSRESVARQRGEHVDAHDITLGEYLTEHWIPAIRSTIRPSTLDHYLTNVNAYLLPRLGHMRLQDITASTLNALYADLLENGRRLRSGGLAPKTVKHVHTTVRTALDAAVDDRLLVHNPATKAKPPKVERPEMEVWSPEEIRTFLDHARDDRLYPVWLLMATTGVRRGEVLGLRWSDVNLERSTVSISQTLTFAGGKVRLGPPKTKQAIRTIAIDAATADGLRRWRTEQKKERLALGEGYVGSDHVVTDELGEAMDPQRFTRLFDRLVASSGLRRVKLHGLRHSYATAALNAGVPIKAVSQRLGHSDVTTTLSIYGHVLAHQDEAAANTVATAILGELSPPVSPV